MGAKDVSIIAFVLFFALSISVLAIENSAVVAKSSIPFQQHITYKVSPSASVLGSSSSSSGGGSGGSLYINLSVYPPDYSAFNNETVIISLLTNVVSDCYLGNESNLTIDDMYPFDTNAGYNHTLILDMTNMSGMFYTYFKCNASGTISDAFEYNFGVDVTEPSLSLIFYPAPYLYNMQQLLNVSFSDTGLGFYSNTTCYYCIGQNDSCFNGTYWNVTQTTILQNESDWYFNGVCSQRFDVSNYTAGLYYYYMGISDLTGNVGFVSGNFTINSTTDVTINQTINITNNQTNTSLNFSKIPRIAWIKYYGGDGDTKIYDVKQTTDGGFIATGYITSESSTSFWLIKISANGTTEWEKTYDPGNGTARWARSVSQTLDGGYILAGTVGDGNSLGDALIIKTDSLGNMEWKKNITSTKYNDKYYDRSIVIKQIVDGTYVLAGTKMYPLYPSWILYNDLIHLDSQGNVLWNNTYDRNLSAATFLEDFQITQDGGYILAGSRLIGTNEALIIKADRDGNKLWNVSLGDSFSGASSTAYRIKELSDGDYIVSAYKILPYSLYSRLWLIKISKSGAVIWDKILYDKYADWSVIYSIDQTFDGGFVLSGDSSGLSKSSSAFPESGFFMFKTDSDGNTEWNTTLPDYGITEYKNYSIHVIHQTSDYGMILGGEIIGSQSFKSDGILVKLKYDCTPNYLIYPNWSECLPNDMQISNYYDNNSCGFTIPSPPKRFCDYCVPNWSVSDYALGDDRMYILNVADNNSCYAKTWLESDKYHGDYSEFVRYMDLNHDNLIGNTPDIHTNIPTLTLSINDTTPPNRTFSGITFNDSYDVRFSYDNKTLITFKYNFTTAPLNLINTTIEVQPNTSSFAYIRITGLNLESQNQTKTVYLDHISGNRLCIKDTDVLSINETSESCTGTDEVSLNCDGTIVSGYSCVLDGGRYKISGLKHSAVREYTYVEPSPAPTGGGDAPSSPKKSSGGGSSSGFVSTPSDIYFNLSTGGKTYNPDKNQKMHFEYALVNHTIYLSDIYDTYVMVQIDDIALNVSINESVKYTLDTNSVLYVELLKVYYSSADISVKLVQSAPEETDFESVRKIADGDASNAKPKNTSATNASNNLITGNVVNNAGTGKIGTVWIVVIVVFIVVLVVGAVYLNVRHKHHKRK